MKEKQKKKTVSVREASIVLLIIVAAIATGVSLKISPNITILFVIALILGYAMFRKVPFDQKGLLMA